MSDLGIASNRVVAGIRRVVNRAGFDITREPFDYRYVRVLQKLGVDCVVDVGANVGQFAQHMRAARFDGRIVSVEPVRSAFDVLAAASASDPKWTVERAAVSDRSGVLTVNISSNSVSSSALPMLGAHLDAAPTSQYVGSEEVTACTIDELVVRQNIDPARALLKIDVQGFESAVLDGAVNTLPSFRAVQLELSLTPLYEGGQLMPDTVARMDRSGFDLWLIEPAFFDPRTGRMLQCDGTFVRR